MSLRFRPCRILVKGWWFSEFLQTVFFQYYNFSLDMILECLLVLVLDILKGDEQVCATFIGLDLLLQIGHSLEAVCNVNIPSSFKIGVFSYRCSLHHYLSYLFVFPIDSLTGVPWTTFQSYRVYDYCINVASDKKQISFGGYFYQCQLGLRYCNQRALWSSHLLKLLWWFFYVDLVS